MTSSRIVLLLLTGLLVLSGCSSTRVVTSWRDDSYQGGAFRKPLILAITKKQIIRAKLEDEFVSALGARGVDAVQSYKTFPDQDDVRPETIREKLAGTDRDSILVTHLVDVKKEMVNVPARTDVYPTGGAYYGPAYYNSFGSYYAQSYTVVSSPGYSYESRTYVAETNLYDVRTDKLVWTVETETENPDSLDFAIKDFVDVIMKDVDKKRVF